MGYNDLEGLAGRRLDRLFVSDERLSFTSDAGVLTYDLEAECCSDTWMADVIGFDKIAGKTIATVTDDLPEGYSVEDGRCRQDEDQAYGVKLTAADGSVAYVVYRNSSNGYYGGWISKHEDGTIDGMAEVLGSWRSEPVTP